MNQYQERDTVALGEHYVRHVHAMTSERLYAKSDIAAELAHRDAVIAELVDALQMATKYVRGEGSEAEIEQCVYAIAKAAGQEGGAA